MLIHHFTNMDFFSGNGPSGICLSYLLSGHKPYLDTATVHPNPILYRKLQETKHLPITEQVKRADWLHIYTILCAHVHLSHEMDICLQDLEYLSEGLEGRSRNPVAVLFDTLLHPNADFGYEFPPVLQWKRDKQQHIPHLVLGRATPGGAWHVSNKFSLWHRCTYPNLLSIPLFLCIFFYPSFFSPQAMEGSMLTISLGIWMELPGVNYRDLVNGKRR